MKKLDRQILFTVLAVHISILLLIWGGLSTLGAACILSIPLIGGTAWIGFQYGKECRENTRKQAKHALLNMYSFRG
jgi:hypothetical protein